LTWHQRSWFLLVRRSLRRVVGRWVLVSGVSARCWVLRDRTLLFGVVCNSLGLILLPALVGGGVGYRPYFENYTVDASIFAR